MARTRAIPSPPYSRCRLARAAQRICSRSGRLGLAMAPAARAGVPERASRTASVPPARFARRLASAWLTRAPVRVRGLQPDSAQVRSAGERLQQRLLPGGLGRWEAPTTAYRQGKLHWSLLDFAPKDDFALVYE